MTSAAVGNRGRRAGSTSLRRARRRSHLIYWPPLEPDWSVVNNIVNTGEELVEWEILMTAQVEEFLDPLYEADRVSHRLVNQAILVLSATARPRAGLWSTRSERPR